MSSRIFQNVVPFISVGLLQAARSLDGNACMTMFIFNGRATYILCAYIISSSWILHSLVYSTRILIPILFLPVKYHQYVSSSIHPEASHSCCPRTPGMHHPEPVDCLRITPARCRIYPCNHTVSSIGYLHLKTKVILKNQNHIDLFKIYLKKKFKPI